MKTAARHAYFLGIGGMGMAPLALYLAAAGWRVQGSDRNLGARVRGLLEAAEIRIQDLDTEGDRPDVVVRTSAAGRDHPVLARAAAAGLPVMRRGEMLAAVAEGRRLVAVAGSHGKTTTTAMLITLLEGTGLPFGYVLGGLFGEEGPAPARPAAAGDLLVAEVDESDGTIEQFSPWLTVALNFDLDHPDRYARREDLEGMFRRLFARTGHGLLVPAGSLLETLARAAGGLEVRTFGAGGDYPAEHLGGDARFSRLRLGGRLPGGEYRLRAAGAFNADNAAAALGSCQWAAGAVEPARLEQYPGVQRRQGCLHASPGWELWEDYAHHPAEIGRLLEMMRATHPGGNLEVIFQPHRYSRTRAYKEAFAEVLGVADRLWLLPVYAADEPEDPEGSLPALLEALGRRGVKAETPADGRELLLALTRETPGRAEGARVVCFVGAGDIEELAWACQALRAENGRGAEAWRRFLQPRVSRETLLAVAEPLAGKTTMRVGGPAAAYAEPARLEDLRLALRAAPWFGLPVFILGRGSNLLVPDEGFPGLVIRLQHEYWRRVEPLPGGRLRVGGGVRLRDLAQEAARLGCRGFEFMEGIPGSVGGSLRMNAGAMGGWMFDVVESVQFITLDGAWHDWPRDAFQVEYRRVRDLTEAVAVSAVLRATGGEEAEAIRGRMQAYMLKRKASQPRDPSAGCIFKNPPGGKAGQLIDTAGLKGLRVGGAEVSTLHGNFVINTGNATAADVLALVRQVHAGVKAAHGVELEPEVMLLGRTWKEVLAG